MKVDFSDGRAIGTICEQNERGQYRICWGTDQSVKLSGWHNQYDQARTEAAERWYKSQAASRKRHCIYPPLGFDQRKRTKL